MKLGVITDGISRDFDYAIRVMTEFGLEYAELQFLWDKEVGTLDADERRRALEIVRKYGVKVACISRHVFVGLPMATTRPGDAVHESHMQGLRNCIEMAHEFECDTVRIMSGRREITLYGQGGAEHWLAKDDPWSRLPPLIEPAVRLAEREGVTLVVETGMTGMAFSAWTARKLLDDIGSPHLKVLWDPGNCLNCDEPAWPDGYEWIRDGRIGHVHMKDVEMDNPKGIIAFRKMGAGQMAQYMQPIADALRAESYPGVVSFESVYRPRGGTQEDGFRSGIELFKRLFG